MTGRPAPRAVYVAFEAFPRPKGASTHIAAMVRWLARSEGSVLLLCCGYGEMPALQHEGCITIRRHKFYHPNMLHRAVDFGRFVGAALDNMAERPAICVFRDPWGGLPVLRHDRPAATVFEVNGLPSWELPYLYPDFRHSAALRAKIENLEQFCLRRADALVTVSSVTRAALMARGADPGRIAVVPNAADERFFDADATAAPTTDALQSGRWFGYLGSLHPWQGVDLLLAAWARIAPDWPGVRLLVLHNGSRTPLKKLRKLVRRLGLEGQVLLHEPIRHELLPPLVKRLEFTCAPLLETYRNTVQGCCPIKIVESMAAGVPVVASDLRVSRELITPEHDGLLVAPGNCREWATALHGLLLDSSRRDRLAAAAMSTARTRFTDEIAYGRLRAALAAAKQRAMWSSAEQIGVPEIQS